ncbi:hypothetical protein PQE66_gp115 [Bacillus phage PBC2]|uniref:Uncharacterized protein n=1 Tax=Bacillus phage PBC2 TaxID=1675029 RepID=A0A218KC09_9CAUD|nr:hypothetical protein PQE66_gp115 [Bacillus phage PBC2]AKQ08430.1 hypothetical protein PBC2_115 [Bacillus phage PBC2]
MWGWKPTFWEGVMLILLIILSNIVSLPCFLLQLMGFKAKRYAKWLCKNSLDQLTFFYDIKVYKD